MGGPAIRAASFGLLIGAGGFIVGATLAPGSGDGETSDEHPLEWDGQRWTGFSPQAKDAFLGGFLAGAAASQAYSALAGDTVFDPGALAERISELRAERALNFPFGVNLYHARLHDYYFYVDRRERPIYRAIAELNFQLQTRHY